MSLLYGPMPNPIITTYGSTEPKPVRLVHRPRLGTNYETIVQQVASIMADLPNMKEPPMLCWDGGGLGGPVVQLARSSGLKQSISIVITGGNNAALVGRDWSVPKALLVGELRLALHQKRLKVAQGFRDRDVLAEELAAFQAKISASGRASFEAAGDEHDDTVLSLAPAWFAARNRPQPVRYVKLDWMSR